MTSETKPTVWITRTAPAAFKSAAVWAEAGYAAAIAPVLELSEPQVMPEPPVRDGVIIFTSGNAVKAFAKHTLVRHRNLSLRYVRERHRDCHERFFDGAAHLSLLR